MEGIAEQVRDHLFSDEGANVFAVLDGASVPGLLGKLYACQPDYVCLYRGELEPDMAEVAPYLVELLPNSDFTDWVIEKGWGRHWGIFAIARADLWAAQRVRSSLLRSLRRHFRAFIIVYDPQGKPMYFRYYDPRVLRLYLPTCNAEETATLFGPVTYYFLEDEEPKAVLRFQQERNLYAVSGSLKQKRILLESD